MNLDTARKVVALEAEAKDLVTRLAKISLQLRPLGYDIKLAGWDWNRRSQCASIAPQGAIGFEIVNNEDRPC